MAQTSLTRTERFILNEIESVPNEIVSSNLVRLAAQMTEADYARVMGRLTKRGLATRVEVDEESMVEITWGGKRALLA